MEKQNITDLINKAKSSNQQKAIQKIVPIVTKEIEEVQFSFYIEKELLKKLKFKALQEDVDHADNKKHCFKQRLNYFIDRNSNKLCRVDSDLVI